MSRRMPTAEQLDYALRLPPGTITLKPLTEWPEPHDRFRIYARVTPGPTPDTWRVFLTHADRVIVRIPREGA